MSGFTVNLLTGVAELLDTAGVGDWSASTAVAASGTAIVLMGLPQGPDRAVSLAAYVVTANAALTDSIIGLNVRCRGDRNAPRVALDLDDAVYAALQGRANANLGTSPNQVRVASIAWQSRADLGPDELQRYECSANYYLRVNRAGDRLE